MSATGRGRPRLGGPCDYFATPKWCVDRLLDEWHPPGGTWVEPSAGNGAIIRAVNSRRSDVHWCAHEIRSEEIGTLTETGATFQIGDFLTSTWPVAPVADVNAVVANPPFTLAQEFIERCLYLFPTAVHAFLLRLPFAASADRAAFMRSRPPSIYVLPDRPAFRNSGSDNTDYAWFVWPDHNGLCNMKEGFGHFRVLATTPLAERDRKLIPVGRTFEVAQVGLFE